MLVGIDSVVSIDKLTVKPSECGLAVELDFIFTIEEYGPNDKAFATDISASIAHKLELILTEGIE